MRSSFVRMSSESSSALSGIVSVGNDYLPAVKEKVEGAKSRLSASLPERLWMRLPRESSR